MADGDEKEVRIDDLVRAAAILCGVICAAGMVAGQFNQIPGFIWPLLLALAAALLELGWRCRTRTNAADLGRLSENYINTTTGAVVLAFIMPALFPNDAYERVRWLVWIDALFLVGALLSIPMARVLLLIAVRLAPKVPLQRPPQRPPGRDQR